MLWTSEVGAVFFALCICGATNLKYVEVFRDDFTGGTINSQKWNRVNAASKVNNELEFYLAEDTWQEHGFLFLRGRRKKHGGRKYTAGRVDTKDKFKFKYGDVEWRAKLPKGKGLWPALWLLQWKCPAAEQCVGNWPPEIDVLEARGDKPNQLTTTLHYGKPPNNHYDSRTHTGPDFTAGFHNFKVLWDPNQVVFYVDGKEVFKTTDKSKIPNEEMYLIMNLAVGGLYSGDPDSSTKFPAHFIIDWVSVHRWQ